MDSTLTAKAQIAAKVLLEDQADELGADLYVVVGLTETRAVFLSSDSLAGPHTATYDEATNNYDGWDAATAGELHQATCRLVERVIDSRATRVF